MVSLLIISAFVTLFVIALSFVVNFIQKRKKLMPEFINGKPTVVFFWAEGKRCREMSSLIEKTRDDFKGSIKVLTFNVTKDHTVTENYLILNVPTVILFNKDGDQLMKINKTRDYSRLESKLKEII